MILLFGIGNSKLKQFYLDDCTCSNCNQTLQHRFTVKGHYFSFFFVPVVPLYKSTTAECIHCRIELPKSQWNVNLIEKFNRAMALKPAKRPWWHFFGCMGVLLVLLGFAVLVGYYYNDLKEDPEIQSRIQELKDVGEHDEIIYEDGDAELNEEVNAEPIDSITTFFKN